MSLLCAKIKILILCYACSIQFIALSIYIQGLLAIEMHCRVTQYVTSKSVVIVYKHSASLTPTLFVHEWLKPLIPIFTCTYCTHKHETQWNTLHNMSTCYEKKQLACSCGCISKHCQKTLLWVVHKDHVPNPFFTCIKWCLWYFYKHGI